MEGARIDLDKGNPPSTGTKGPLRAKHAALILKGPMELSDVIYILFLLIVIWIALNWDSDIGGGKRMRAPAAC